MTPTFQVVLYNYVMAWDFYSYADAQNWIDSNLTGSDWHDAQIEEV